METKKQVTQRRNSRKKKKKKNKALKVVLFLICLVVIAGAVFVGAVKFMQPDFDFKTLVPKEIATFVDAKINGNTTEVSQITTATTTLPAQKPVEPFYMEEKDFDFNSSKGAYVGNLLNGGLVERDNGYVYHIVQGDGIYRFKTDTESYERVYKSSDKMSCLNIVGDYLYFINNNNLCRVKKGTSKLENLLEGPEFAYIYGDYAYTVSSKFSEISVFSISKNEAVFDDIYYETLIRFVGISLNGVFFTSTDNMGITKYYYVDLDTHKTTEFMQSTKADEICSMIIENGYMYYFKRQMDNTYDLIRQKVGSQNQVTLVEDTTCQQPVTVSKNLVFYGNFDDNKYQIKEYNMNSKDTKTMLSASDVASADDAVFQHGGEYDFIIGTKENGDKIYMGSSNLTSSTNVMKFKEGKWKY